MIKKSTKPQGGVREKMGAIREYTNHPWKQTTLLADKVKWEKLCASMDVVEDSQLAIESYFNLKEFNALKGGYLFLYGLLQAFYLQQDAINHLSQVLFNKKINFKEEYPALYSTRELRNDAVGHPTDRNNETSFHYISMGSITKKGFTLASFFPKQSGPKYNKIDLYKLKEQQELCVILILDEVINMLGKEQKEHKKKFKNQKLKDLIPNDPSYSIGKIYNGISSNYPLAKMNFNLIKKTYNNLKKGINERYGSCDALSGVGVVVEKIDYILNKFTSWFDRNNIFGNKDAEIFLDTLNAQLKELYQMANEIDEEFSEEQ